MDDLTWLEKVIVGTAVDTIALHLHLPLAADKEFITDQVVKVFESGKLRGIIIEKDKNIEKLEAELKARTEL